MSGNDDQREALHSLGKMGRVHVAGGHQPVSDGKPLGAPPTGGSAAMSPSDERRASYDRAATQAFERQKAEAQARLQPIVIRCGCCEHEWTCCYLPMPMSQAATMMKEAKCPKGCTAQTFLANGLGG